MDTKKYRVSETLLSPMAVDHPTPALCAGLVLWAEKNYPIFCQGRNRKKLSRADHVSYHHGIFVLQTLNARVIKYFRTADAAQCIKGHC